MTYQEVIENARKNFAGSNSQGKCKACPICNGLACKNTIPGPGSKGVGDTAILNYNAWQSIRLRMDTIYKQSPVDMSLELFGKKFKYPFFAGPVGAVQLHYSDAYDDVKYNEVLTSACAKEGIAAFTGDGTNPDVMKAAAQAIAKCNGAAVPTVKPWNIEKKKKKMALVMASHPFAMAMDIDAAGLPFLKNLTPPAGSKSVEELAEIIKAAGIPFIIKGIMTEEGAIKALQAGAQGIIVSNHGGRVLDQCEPTASVLSDIVEAVDGQMKVLVDGGIRTGTDVFKALALGADGVVIARPFVTAVYGGGEEGVSLYIQKIAGELEDAMRMTGALTLKDIDANKINY